MTAKAQVAQERHGVGQGVRDQIDIDQVTLEDCQNSAESGQDAHDIGLGSVADELR